MNKTIGLVCVAAVSSSAFGLDVSKTVAEMERHYDALLAHAAAEATPEKPIPYGFKDGQRVYIAPEDWCSGFFPGTLWHLYEATGDVKWKKAAAACTEKLERIRRFNLHHDTGFMLMSSYGNGWKYTGDEKYADVLRDGAQALATRFRPKLAVMQSWGLWKPDWHCPVIIDNMLNLELLTWAAGNPSKDDFMNGVAFGEMARLHADTTDRNHFRPDGSAYHLLDYDPKDGSVLRRFGGQGYDAERGVWSRGQAWAVYGFAMMHRETHDPRYLHRAMKAADWCLAAPGVPADRIPYWDYCAPNRPHAPRDVAAATVLASGLLELCGFVPEDKRRAYFTEAEKILSSLVTPAYFAKIDEAGGFALKHCTGSFPAGSQVDMPFNYADYYFLEALLRYEVAKERPRIILDTDMLSDWDDVGALAMLHALADRGEAEILATVACTVGGASVGAVEVVNGYYGRAALLVGCCRKGVEAAKRDGGHAKYRRMVEKFPTFVRHPTTETAPDAVKVYRRILSAQPDGSVTICSLGFLTNLRDLLASGPDEFSSLAGRELVAKKVKRWVAMACNHPNGKEYNSQMDPPASKAALADWPTPIVFVDFQYGRHLYAGRRVAESKIADSPVRWIFKENTLPLEKVTPTSWDQAAGHPSWDEAAVLVAVRGLRYFNVERGTYRMVGDDGTNEWVGDAASPNCRVTEKMPRADVGCLMDELMCRPPPHRPPRTM